ncbi:hypothetical protein CCACVL1_12131 [Corchorus capsularis]|uniref:KIB1-4 beta-propeller domain-containing protein n=1 Tax=Corchorus capsularis TaxID=210143 RepID=A0A1R3IHB6_COCAP|nr:hypothetical protein CCACVL1_12131 [Corchorus capsularis]
MEKVVPVVEQRRPPHLLRRPQLPLPNFDGIEFSSPWLISGFSTRKNNGICRFFNPINNHTLETNMNPQFSYNSRICFAKYGWLLMIQDNKNELLLFLFEPLTKEKILLPPLLDVDEMKLLITSSPQSPDCMVIGLTALNSSSNTTIEICTCKLGDLDWQFYERIVLDGLKLRMACCTPTFYKGKLYCLEKMGNLLTFDPTSVDGSFKCIQNEDLVECTDDEDEDGVESCTEDEDCVGNEDIGTMSDLVTLTFDISPLLGEMKGYQIFMVENDGDLLAIFVTKRGRTVYVYKWDESHRSFGSVKSLGDNMVFVSYGGAAFSQKAVVRGTGNKIYFPTFFLNGAYAFYSLATKRYHSFFGFSPANPCCPPSQHVESVWLCPIQQ